MSRPAVFFDRDNTLIANSDYLGDPDGVALLPGAADAVARVRALGFATVVVSNQSGVGRGMFGIADVNAVNARMDAALLELHPDAVIDRHEFSPHHPEASIEAFRGEHRRRKPQPGMLMDAATSLDLDLSKSWLIGDAPRDIEAGHRAGCRTILLREPLATRSPAADEAMRIAPDYIASSLQDAVDFIEMHLETTAAESSVATSVFSTADEPVSAISAGTSDEPLIGIEDATPVSAAADDVVDEAATDDRVEATEAEDQTVDEAVVADRLFAAGAEPEREAPHVTPPVIAPVASHLGVMKAAIDSAAPPAGTDKQTVLLLERIVEELRRANDPPQDFSVAKMLAGVVQGFALASLFAALLVRDNPPPSTTFQTLMMLAIFLQAMVASLVLMGR